MESSFENPQLDTYSALRKTLQGDSSLGAFNIVNIPVCSVCQAHSAAWEITRFENESRERITGIVHICDECKRALPTRETAAP